ncbi:MAG TPA: hypothetical protein VIW70_08345 [Rubrivivax sp.]
MSRQSLKEFPPRQKPGSFDLDRVMEAVMQPQKSRHGTGRRRGRMIGHPA